jgi:hypothetical protein
MFLDDEEVPNRAPRNGMGIDLSAVDRRAGLRDAGEALRVTFENA